MNKNHRNVNSGRAHKVIKRFVGASRKLVLLPILVLIMATACTADLTLSEPDEVAIYSAVIHRIYTEDDTFGGTFNAPTVYLVATTDDGVGDPEIEQSEPRTLSESVQEDIVDNLTELPTRIVWVDDTSAVAQAPTSGAVIDDGVIMTIGNIHLQSDGSVLVSGSIYIANMASGGQTYIVEKVNGAWEITGTTGFAWIS